MIPYISILLYLLVALLESTSSFYFNSYRTATITTTTTGSSSRRMDLTMKKKKISNKGKSKIGGSKEEMGGVGAVTASQTTPVAIPVASISKDTPSSSSSKTSTSSLSDNTVDINFEDDAVDCVSSGGTFSTNMKDEMIKNSDQYSGKTFIRPPTLSIEEVERELEKSNKEKNVNFFDEDVDCTSEGGTWSLPVDSVSTEFKPPVQPKKTITEFAFGALSAVTECFKYSATANDITLLCDAIDELVLKDKYSIEVKILKLRRYHLLCDLMGKDRQGYIAVADFLSPNRIPRSELPNLQLQLDSSSSSSSSSSIVPDCELRNVTYIDTPLDSVLLSIFRSLVQKEIGYKSEVKGITGLLDEGRYYYLSGASEDDQHFMVRNTLRGLLTPFLPPFYRIFMAGIVPCKENNDPDWLIEIFQSIRNSLPSGSSFDSGRRALTPGNQIGPWFYAPTLTAMVTPPFLSFLVGKSSINRRKDGKRGGMVVEKCRFLQESGCKGLCLHQCKLPAQQFFKDELGLSLTVSPNFVTQECQWSWGEEPVLPQNDASFPEGCLNGCPTRSSISNRGSSSGSSSSGSSSSVAVSCL